MRRMGGGGLDGLCKVSCGQARCGCLANECLDEVFETMDIPFPAGESVGFRLSVAIIAVVVEWDVVEKRDCCRYGRDGV